MKIFFGFIFFGVILIAEWPLPTPRTGTDYALFFAVDNYAGLSGFRNLRTPIHDAETIAKELEDVYDFQSTIYRNSTKTEIFKVLEKWQKKAFQKDDQLFVFFSGHGDFWEFANSGFFIPGKVKRADYSDYIDLKYIRNGVAQIDCEHILLAIDACYSGTIDEKVAFRGGPDILRNKIRAKREKENTIARQLRNRSRLVITSGGKERTPEGIDHSPFAYAILKALRSNYTAGDGLLTYNGLLTFLERVEPAPYMGHLPGHEEGGFVFEVKENKGEIFEEWPMIQKTSQPSRAFTIKDVQVLATLGGRQVIHNLDPFNIVYVFDELPSGYARIGYDLSGPVGYLPLADIQKWDRLCLNFTPRNGRKSALIFDKQKTLTQFLRGPKDIYNRKAKPNTHVIAMEPDTDISTYRFSMLLPVLDRQHVKLETSYNKLYNIGFLSGIEVDYSPVIERPKKTSTGEASLEIMFVIDATRGMGPFLKATKVVIGNVIKRITRSREISVRFGVTAYRDYVDNQAEMEYITKQYIDLTYNTAAIIKTLDEVDEAGVSSEDFPEAVFDGYYAAMTETGWHEKPNTLRLIVLIGDASGHEVGSPKNPFNYSTEFLINKASEMRIRTISIKINSGTSDDNKAHAQFLEIAHGATLADKGQYFEVEYSDDDVPDEFITKTSVRIEAEISRLEKLIDVVEESKKSGSVSMPNILRATDRAIIPKKTNTRYTRDKSNHFSRGWLSEVDTDGQKLVNTYAYLTKDEFDKMMTYIKLIEHTIKNPEVVDNSVFRAVLETATGVIFKDNNIEGHYKGVLELPVKTDILRIPIEELSSWGADRKARMLELIKGKLLHLENWNGALENWHIAPGGSSMKYTFLPTGLLP